MRKYYGIHIRRERGAILALVVVVFVILLLIGMGLLTITYGVRLRAIKFMNQTVAMLAAEAGYEQGIFWMNQQPSILSSIANNVAGCTGSNSFGNSSYNYTVQFNSYIGGKPVFNVVSTGLCGAEQRVVNVNVIQAVDGWDMGLCRIISGLSSTTPVYFADGELVDMPVHINKNSSTQIDINIDGSPQFLQSVLMGQSRYGTNGSDMYSGLIGLFNGGISFDQPDTRITDQTAVQAKLTQFQSSTNPTYCFTPVAATLSGVAAADCLPAVQLEFYKSGNVGMVKITNNCTVVGYQRPAGSTNDYKLATSGGNPYMTYDIYAYHYAPQSGQPNYQVVNASVASTYVSQTFAGQQSAPGGQIFVNGNVILGSDTYKELTVNGVITVVATGNIWIGDSILVDGPHTTDTYAVPTSDNPNAIGLIAGGVVKVIDPGLSNYAAGGTNSYPGPAAATKTATVNGVPTTYNYAPVGNGTAGSNNRVLSTPDDPLDPTATEVEAAVTCGGGGWGAENVNVSGTNYGGRKQASTANQDDLILRGTICEAVRGIVGIVGTDGYIKHYYLDSRLLAGVLPGNIWFSGRFIPAPAGWHDYSQ